MGDREERDPELSHLRAEGVRLFIIYNKLKFKEKEVCLRTTNFVYMSCRTI